MKGSEINANKKIISKLLKLFYSLKQTPRLRYKRLSKFLLEKLSFKQINADHSIFLTPSGINNPIVSIFVNNIKAKRVKGPSHIKKVKTGLAVIFGIVDMESINFYLGLKVEIDYQKKY